MHWNTKIEQKTLELSELEKNSEEKSNSLSRISQKLEEARETIKEGKRTQDNLRNYRN